MTRRRNALAQPDRRALERAGWRTLLDYRENHVRGADGTLLAVMPEWTAEAECVRDRVLVATATASRVDDVWARLRVATRELDRR